MKATLYETISSSVLFRELTSVFPRVTGLGLYILSALALAVSAQDDNSRNFFCQTVVGTPRGCSICHHVQARLRQCGSEPQGRCEVACVAGLMELAVPVQVGGEHVATLVAGPVLAQKPTPDQLAQLSSELQLPAGAAEWVRAEQAYRQIPVFSRDQREATQWLMSVFAGRLAATVGDGEIPSVQPVEPACVAFARNYVEAHLLDNVRTRQVAQAAHVSLQHFCRVFRQTTGETFTDYLGRRRVERARQLCANPQLTITEVALGSGFRSLTWFDQVFKRHTGQTPRQFRAGFKMFRS